VIEEEIEPEEYEDPFEDGKKETTQNPSEPIEYPQILNDVADSLLKNDLFRYATVKHLLESYKNDLIAKFIKHVDYWTHTNREGISTLYILNDLKSTLKKMDEKLK